MSLVRALNIAIGVVLAVLLARLLGADDYGLYIFALALVQMMSLPVQMGLPTLIQRQIAIYRAHRDGRSLVGIIRWSIRLLALAYGVVCLFAFGYCVLGYYHQEPTPPLDVGLFVLSVALVAVLSLVQLSGAILAGLERVFHGMLPDTLIRPLALLALVVTLQFLVGISATWVMGLHVLASIVALIWALAFVKRYFRIDCGWLHRDQPPLFHSRTWLTSLVPLSLVSGAQIISQRLDIVMLGLMTSTEDVAVYSVAIQLAGALLLAQTIVNAIIAPRAARMYATDDLERFRELAVSASRLSFAAACVFLVVIVLFGRWFIDLAFGNDFSGAYAIALVVCVGALFNTAVGAVGTLLNMTGHETTTARVIVFSTVLNGLMNVILIPMYGAVGAAVATSATTIVSQTILWRKVCAKTGVRSDFLAFISKPTR